MRKFNIISCVNTNLAIGNSGKLIYHISDDLKTFKSITLGGVVIMGRNTYESLPKGVLPNRINIIITSNKDYKVEGGYVVHSIEESIELCEKLFDDLEWFVIGGANIYQQFLDKDVVDKMYITQVTDNTEGDVFFPNELNSDKWRTFYKSPTIIDRTNNLKYYFIIFKRNNISE